MWLKRAALNGNEEAAEILKTVPSYGRKPFSADVIVKADNGSSEDQLSLGRCYLYGEGVPKDIESAIKWLKMAAENNSYIGSTKNDAQLLLAKIYEKESFFYNPKEAFVWYKAAAESGHVPSKIKTAELLLTNKNLSDKPKKDAEQYLLDACSSGDPKAELKLAEFYLDNGEGNKKVVLPLLYQAAGKGEGRAAYMIGSIFKAGKITVKSNRMALNWFQKAKLLGYPSAQDEIDAYEKNPPSPELSDALIQKAKNGDTEAELKMGLIYYQGEGIGTDYYEAEKWLRKAAQKNAPIACRILGELYSRDLFIDEELYALASDYGIRNAEPWLKQAAESGNIDAAKLLGVLLIQKPNDDEVISWVEKPKKLLDPLARNGDLQATQALQILRSRWPYPYSKELLEEAEKEVPEALFDLGWAYMYGEGVVKDPRKAVEMFERAYKKGQTHSAEKIYIIYKNVLKNEKEAEKWEREKSSLKRKNATEEQNKDNQKLLEIKNSIIEKSLEQVYADSPQLLAKAAFGTPDAQLAFGIHRLEGYLVKNLKSLEWYKRGVQSGDAESAYRIGMAYISEELGLKRDFGEAEKYLKKASNQNHSESQAKLGIMYIEGKNISKNSNEGIKLLKKSAENGNYEAKTFLEAHREK